MPRPLPELPIDALIPSLIEVLGEVGAAVVVAPPGSGKTTRIPPAILDAGLAGGGRVVVCQPRRVAARLAAQRIASERGSRLGAEVGWRVRFEARCGPETRIEVVTEGILTRRLQRDPFLEGVGAVVLDELHERSLQTDLALALLAELRRDAREDLVLAAMSATLDPGPVAAFLDCPVLESRGRSYPVALRYAERVDDRPLAPRCAEAVRRALTDGGHVLAFLPGAPEIRQVARALEDLPQPVLPLHGGLSAAEQDRALAPSDRQRVILATNIAETSVTLEGVRAVVDSGLVRRARFDGRLGMDRLETVAVSQDSADQRAGRAGRTGPGVAYRLWTEGAHRRLPAAARPEIERADLSRLVLEVIAWGSHPARARWLQPPPAEALERAEALLESLGATRSGRLTDRGRALLELPLHPRLGAVVLAGARAGRLEDAAWMAALASERDPFRGVPGDGESDLQWRLERLRAPGMPPGAEPRAVGAVRRTARQLLAVARAAALPRGGAPVADPARLLLAGFPDRVALRRAPGSPRLLLAGGSGALLHRSSAVARADLLVAVGLELRGHGEEPVVRCASAVERDWLETRTERITRFDARSGRVVRRRLTRYRALVLEDVADGEPPEPERAAALLLEAARADPRRALGEAPALRALLDRLDFLARHMPELALPDRERALDGALQDLVHGRRSFAELRRADAAGAVRARLPHPAARALDREAPTHLRVPSGARIRLDYRGGEPVLAARIQQLFGMARSPRLAGGRVPVTLHLLAPSGRPVQVTRDLESFWARTYPQIRRELRGRYPRHAWPERPGREHAEDRPRRRGR